MHKTTRAARAANQARRAAAAHRQRPVPLEVQREIAAERRATREAEWAKQGYLHVSYEGMPRAKPRRTVSSMFENVLSDVFLYILHSMRGNFRGRVQDDRRSNHLPRRAA